MQEPYIITLGQRLEHVAQTVAGLEYQTRREGFDPEAHAYDRSTLWFLAEFRKEHAWLTERIAQEGEAGIWKQGGVSEC